MPAILVTESFFLPDFKVDFFRSDFCLLCFVPLSYGAYIFSIFYFLSLFTVNDDSIDYTFDLSFNFLVFFGLLFGLFLGLASGLFGYFCYLSKLFLKLEFYLIFSVLFIKFSNGLFG